MTTDDMMTLRALLEKSSDADLLREMIGFAAERLMELEVRGLTGAGHGERTPERITHRNGYRERSWETRAGTVALKIPKLRKGSYFPALPCAPADGREGADGGDPGGLHQGGLDPLGRRSGAGHGDDRHLEEPGLQVVRRDRRQDRKLPRAAAGGRLALSLAGCDLCEGAPERAHRPGRGHRGRRRQRPGPARGPRHGDRRVRGRDLLDRVPALPRPARAQRRATGDLRRPQGPEGRRDPHPRRHLPEMSRALHAQPARPCRPAGPARRLRLRRHRLRPGGRRGRKRPVAPGRRPAQAQGTQARGPHGRGRARRAGLYELPRSAPPQAASTDEMDKRFLRCRGRMAAARTTSWRRAAPRLQAPPGCLNQALPA